MSTLFGKWKGSYTQVFEDGSEGKTKNFEMTLVEEEDEELSGEIIDISEGNRNPEKAKVSGFIMGDTISFVKIYPYLFFFNEKGELQTDKSKPHPEISYHGEIQENEISGEWDMEVGTMQFYSDFYSKLMSGTWKVERIRD